MADTRTLQQLARDVLNSGSDGPALRDDRGWYDWSWVRDTGANIIEALDANGVQPDQTVGLVARNRPTIVAALLALIASGRSVRMLYAFQSTRMLIADIAGGGIGALIAADEDFAQPVCEAVDAAQICGVSVHEETGIGVVNDVPDRPARGAGGVRADGQAPFIEVLTSGTTGAPKHFGISHDLVRRRLLSMNLTYSGGDDESAGTSIMFYPLGTISGLYSYLPPALDGRPVILQEKFDLDGWLAFVAEYRPGRTSLPTPAIDALLQRGIPPAALAGLAYIGTSAARTSAETQQAFEERYGTTLLVSYGATEFGGPVAAMSAELSREWGVRKRGSAGRAWAGARLRVVDPATGLELPRGSEGLLEVVAPTLGERWIRTSDRAMIDADDFLFHRGRADGAITRGGFSVLPEVIEEIILRHPQVAGVTVVGLTHERLGEVPAAVVQPQDMDSPPELAELERHVRDNIYATHVPAHFRLVRQLPLNHSMTVDLPRIRAMFDRKSEA